MITILFHFWILPFYTLLRVTFHGRGPGGLGPPLVLDQTEDRRAQKIFLGDQASSFSKGLDDPPPRPTPLYLSEGLHPALFCVIITLPWSKGCKLDLHVSRQENLT